MIPTSSSSYLKSPFQKLYFPRSQFEHLDFRFGRALDVPLQKKRRCTLCPLSIFLKRNGQMTVEGERLNAQIGTEGSIYPTQMKSQRLIIAKSAECTHVHEHFERISKPRSSFGFSIKRKKRNDCCYRMWVLG
jgi:hypothetical protein